MLLNANEDLLSNLIWPLFVVEEAMRINKKLVSMNKKKESTIAALKKVKL